MELRHAEALATVQEADPQHTRRVLSQSGFGDLADQWIDAAAVFESVARATPDAALQDREVRSHVVRAYAKLCMAWYRITQLRDQAMGLIERQRQPT